MDGGPATPANCAGIVRAFDTMAGSMGRRPVSWFKGGTTYAAKRWLRAQPWAAGLGLRESW